QKDINRHAFDDVLAEIRRRAAIAETAPVITHEADLAARAFREIEKLRKERIFFHRVVKRAYEESKDLKPCPFCRRDPHEIYCLVTQLGKMMTWAGEPQDE